MAEKRAETQVFLSHPTEKKRRRSDSSLHVSEDATTAPRQRKRKSGTDPVAADLSLDLGQTDISSEPDPAQCGKPTALGTPFFYISSEPDLPMKEERNQKMKVTVLRNTGKILRWPSKVQRYACQPKNLVYSAALFKKFLLVNTCCIIYLNIERCFLRSIFLVVYYVLLIARNIPHFTM